MEGCTAMLFSLAMFNLLTVVPGDTPFADDSLVAVYGKIMNHRNSLQFPDDVELKQSARTFISALIRERYNNLEHFHNGREMNLHHA